jgi:hypothetical protein
MQQVAGVLGLPPGNQQGEGQGDQRCGGEPHQAMKSTGLYREGK